MLLPKGKSEALFALVTDQAVGLGCPNKRDDVLLVQFFLAAFSSDPLIKNGRVFSYEDKKGRPYNYSLANRRPLVVDGVCGNETVAYIKHFQQEAAKNETSQWLRMVTDGVVSPVRQGEPWNERTGQVLTIVRMNVEYAAMFGAHRHRTIGDDPLFPNDLKRVFYMQ
jgi:hypothetical protein